MPMRLWSTVATQPNAPRSCSSLVTRRAATTISGFGDGHRRVSK